MTMEAEELQKRLEELKVMSEKQEGRVNYYETKLHSIIVGYFIWERVFFFGISKTTSPSFSSLNCNNGRWWVILALNSLCTFVHMLLFLDAARMLYRTEQQLNVILQTHDQLYRKISAIKQEAKSMEAGDHSSQEDTMLPNSNPPFRRSGERKFYIYAMLCALLGVASIELCASKFVLCD